MPLPRTFAIVLSLWGLACGEVRSTGEAPGKPMTAGRDVPAWRSPNAYGHAVANLRREHWADVREGKAVFVTTWVAPGGGAAERAIRGPGARVREGLGPRFNATACQSCHFKDGRGAPPSDEGRASRRERAEGGAPRLLRIGVTGVRGELLPEPTYGGQLQDRALSPLAPEGTFEVRVRAIEGRYPDGAPFVLEAPVTSVHGWSRGAPHERARFSMRQPLSLIGLGLLEAVPEEVIVARADPEDSNGDGIAGRPNRVIDPRTGKLALGRFGWKASQPSLIVQNAAALREDLGVTTPVFPEEPCLAGDTACETREARSAFELSAEDLERLTRYTRLLGPPARRRISDERAARGEALFTTFGCAACHVPELRTGPVADLPELAEQTIEPYTDLLLHDMGDELSDDRPDGQATGRQWRTAPLWGLGLMEVVSGEVRLLHDGRARNVEEAILWHGGEATRAREAFARAPREDRGAMIAFLGTL